MRLQFALLAALSLTLAARAENWPQWRGPAFNGSSPEKNLPETWTKETVKWTAPLPGPSGATPAIWGDAIFVTSPDKQKNLLLLCLDRKDGKVRWQKQLATGDINKGKANMASPSPITDGKTVYAFFGTGDLAALDFDGNIKWQRNLGADYGRFAIMWLYGSSPLLFDGKLYVQVLQRTPAPADYSGLAGGDPTRESYLLALDPANGKTLWKHVRPSAAKMESLESYATPIPHTGADGKAQILVVGGDCLTGHDPTTGAELWRGYGLNPKGGEWMRIVASPVSAAGLAIACGPKKEPLLAWRTDGKGDVTTTGLAWKSEDRKTPDVCTPAFDGQRLFVLDGDGHTLTCLDPKTGAKKWSGELPERGVIRSSPTVADGKVYIVNEKGTVMVCAAGDEFKVLATIPMGDAEGTRASVVASGGQLFLRTTAALYCVGK
jgi:outer membrane protein assembly factor BamB